MPTLTFEELAEAGSIDALAEMYTNHGAHFRNQNEFLRQVRREWKSEKERIRDDTLDSLLLQQHAPSEVPHVFVALGSQEFYVFGINHGTKNPEYLELIKSAVTGPGTWCFEQNLHSEGYDARNSIEAIDHGLLTRPQLVRWGLESSTPMVMGSLILEIPKIVYKWAINEPIFVFSKESRRNLVFAALPPGYFAEPFPAYVNIEKTSGRLPVTIRRSGYLAEFMRALHLQDCNMMTGFVHVPEIEYFLRNPIKDAEVADCAHADVELLASDPEKYEAKLISMRRRTYQAWEAGRISGNFLGQAACFASMIGLTYVNVNR